MKKWLLLIIVILGLSVIAAFVFFPGEVNSSFSEKINCNINNINTYIINGDNWVKWWPGSVQKDSVSGKNIFTYNGYEYALVEKKYNAIVIRTKGNGFTINGAIYFIPKGLDNVYAELKYAIETNGNPVSRVNLHWENKKIEDNFAGIMKSMKDFLGNKDNVYGIHIDQVMVKDTILVTTNFTSEQFPGTEKIYSYVKGIKDYIASHHGQETNFPMLHVLSETGMFKIQLAIPIAKEIPGNATYLIKYMVPGKILVGEIKGGAYTANQAIKNIGQFMSDYHYTSPAIPFESLVTNRTLEPDTTKWITRIYYPVM